MAELARRGASVPARIRDAARKLGPALVLATAVLGPGSLTLHTLAGSLYGYRLLWVPVASTILMVVYTYLSARIAIVTDRTFFEIVRAHFGATASLAGGISAFLAVVAFQSGNTAGVGFALDAVFGGGVRIWSAALTAAALGLILLPDLYRKLELLVKVVVGVMLLTFLGTLAIVGVRAEEIAAGFVPRFPDGASVFLTLGIMATTFSIVAAVYQGYLVREKRLRSDDLERVGMDSVFGIGVLGAISVVVLLTSAGVIRTSGEPVFSAQAMALQLEPVAGPLAFYLFALGFFFAAFSSQIINPLVGSTLLMDSVGGDPRMDGRPVKVWAATILALGLVPVLLFAGSPVELLRMAQGVAVVALPILGYFVLALSRSRALMGAHASRGWVALVAILGYLTVLGISVNYLFQLIDSG